MTAEDTSLPGRIDLDFLRGGFHVEAGPNGAEFHRGWHPQFTGIRSQPAIASLGYPVRGRSAMS